MCLDFYLLCNNEVMSATTTTWPHEDLLTVLLLSFFLSKNLFVKIVFTLNQ